MPPQQYAQPPALILEPTKDYAATLHTNHGAIAVELFAAQAPRTVNNFVFLARDGFYDGGIFHRVIPNFMIQGGDPTGSGRGGPGYQFQDEFDPALTFSGPGLLAMANAGPGTNGSQFFITVAATPHLNNRHTIFGRLTAGQEVADAIANAPRDGSDRPRETVTIATIEIAEQEKPAAG